MSVLRRWGALSQVGAEGQRFSSRAAPTAEAGPAVAPPWWDLQVPCPQPPKEGRGQPAVPWATGASPPTAGMCSGPWRQWEIPVEVWGSSMSICSTGKLWYLEIYPCGAMLGWIGTWIHGSKKAREQCKNKDFHETIGFCTHEILIAWQNQ